jgi:hypothetical protein
MKRADFTDRTRFELVVSKERAALKHGDAWRRFADG